MVAVSFRITGRVQGVGFRYFTLRAASRLGLRGWVRNEPDGSVLCNASGEPAAMDELRKILWRGPTFGRTDDIAETPLSEETAALLPRFTIDV